MHTDDLDLADTPTTLPGYEPPGELTRHDVEQVLARAARDPDGSFRVLAARAAPGRAVGGFKYYVTRPDDANDIVPHEHRRELRALKVFAAWTNLVNDTVIEEHGRGAVRHYLQDVGSTFGTGAHGAREWDEGYEYLYDGGKLLKRLVTFGFYIQPWQVVRYEELPEIGRFEGQAFHPERWRTRVPAAAVLRARDDDTFWAALRVSAFTDDTHGRPRGRVQQPGSGTVSRRCARRAAGHDRPRIPAQDQSAGPAGRATLLGTLVGIERVPDGVGSWQP